MKLLYLATLALVTLISCDKAARNLKQNPDKTANRLPKGKEKREKETIIRAGLKLVANNANKQYNDHLRDYERHMHNMEAANSKAAHEDDGQRRKKFEKEAAKQKEGAFHEALDTFKPLRINRLIYGSIKGVEPAQKWQPPPKGSQSKSNWINHPAALTDKNKASKSKGTRPAKRGRFQRKKFPKVPPAKISNKEQEGPPYYWPGWPENQRQVHEYELKHRMPEDVHSYQHPERLWIGLPSESRWGSSNVIRPDRGTRFLQMLDNGVSLAKAQAWMKERMERDELKSQKRPQHIETGKSR